MLDSTEIVGLMYDRFSLWLFNDVNLKPVKIDFMTYSYKVSAINE